MNVKGWYAVSVATRGVVALFPVREDAEDYANALRDAIGEARGLTSAVSVKEV